MNKFFTSLVLSLSIVTSLQCTSGTHSMDKSAHPSLSQKIGQMIMVGFTGTTPSDPGVKTLLVQAEKGEVGGVVFFGYNIENPQQVKQLTSAFVAAQGSVPLFIALDQEGGKVQRLKSKNGFQDFASAYQVGRSQSASDACTYYQAMAQEIKAAGFNVNLGPVVDLHALPTDNTGKAACPVIGGIERSFSNDPQKVVEYAAAFIEAHHKEGLLTSLKHYPGHGLAKKDSHKGMVDITHTYNPLERVPFRKLISRGVVDMVMVAHLVDRKMDSQHPVTLSPYIIERWLRGEDRFQGVVISDDLHMGAIQQHYDLERVVVKAILAGNDILVFSNNTLAAQGVKDFKPKDNLAQEVREIIERAVATGKIPQQRIDASYARIMRLKARLH